MEKTTLILFVLLALAFSAKACDCTKLPLEQELREVDRVFWGRVIAINDRSYPIKYEFEVLKTWKGKRRRKVTVSSGIGQGDCGFTFEQGETYIVYAKRGKTDECRRTAKFSESGDYALLNWQEDRFYRRALKKAKPGPLTKAEAQYFGSILHLPLDSLEGKRLGIFDSQFNVSKRDFFRTWGGHPVDLEYLVLLPEERKKYGIDVMVVTWTNGAIVDSEKEYLLHHLKGIPPEVSGEEGQVLSRKQ